MGTERPKVPNPRLGPTERPSVNPQPATAMGLPSHSPAQGEPFLPLGLDRHPFTDFVPP